MSKAGRHAQSGGAGMVASGELNRHDISSNGLVSGKTGISISSSTGGQDGELSASQ